jgi:hypothetical protein
MTTIDITPNYANLHRTFLEQASLSINLLILSGRPNTFGGARISRDDVLEFQANESVATMRATHDMLISLNLALAAATTVEEIEAVRTVFSKVTEATSKELTQRRDYAEYLLDEEKPRSYSAWLQMQQPESE